MEFTYEMLIPIIVDVQQDGNTVHCTFGIPGTDQLIESSAGISRDRSAGGQVQKTATRMASRQGRMAAGRMIRGALGGGILGRIGARAVRTGWRSMDPARMPSGSEKQDAVVSAFNKVSHHFQYNPNTGQFSQGSGKAAPGGREKEAAKKPQTPFEKQMERGAISNSFEREILARMLVEIANTDGNIGESERSFIEDVMGDDMPNLQSIMMKDPISPVECESLDDAVRETVYMLAWCMACADYRINPEQADVLEQFADMFGFPPHVEQNLRLWAKLQMLEMAVDVHTGRQELFEVADSLELDHVEAEKHHIFMKKLQ